MMRIKVLFFTILGVMALAGLGLAKQAALQNVVDKIDARYAQTKDLQAEFIQKTTIEGFETELSSTGRLFLKKPGLLRWDYLQPSEEQIFVDGDQVLMYVPAHQQVLKGTLTQMAASKGPLALLQGVGKLSQQFTITESVDFSKQDANSPRVTLVPHPQGSQTPTIQKISLKLFPQTYLIEEITLHEVSGNVSRVTFKDLKVNSGLSAKVLQFEIPEDVVVVDLPTLN